MPKGDCFEAAYLAAERLHRWYPDLLVVHGTPINQGPRKGERYWHAWVEMPDGTVIDQSSDRNIVMTKENYYRIGRLEEKHVWRYTVMEH